MPLLSPFSDITPSERSNTPSTDEKQAQHRAEPYSTDVSNTRSSGSDPQCSPSTPGLNDQPRGLHHYMSFSLTQGLSPRPSLRTEFRPATPTDPTGFASTDLDRDLPQRREPPALITWDRLERGVKSFFGRREKQTDQDIAMERTHRRNATASNPHLYPRTGANGSVQQRNQDSISQTQQPQQVSSASRLPSRERVQRWMIVVCVGVGGSLMVEGLGYSLARR